MTGGGVLSGGIVFAVAAVLWLAYLVPIWIRRHEYVTTERNSVRLQQTLRILAETAEVPEEVRLEVTARGVAERERTLKRILAEREAAARAQAEAEVLKAKAEADAEARRARAEARAAAARAQAEAAEAEAVAAAETARLRAKGRLRRSRRRARLVTTAVMLLSLIGTAVGSVLAIGGASVLLPAGAAGLLVLSVLVSARMARVGRRRPEAPAPAVRAEEPVRAEQPVYDAPLPEEEPAPVSWTPTALPRPLHLAQGSTASAVIAEQAARRRLREAAVAEAMGQRARELEIAAPAAASLEERRAASAEEASRYAAMGVVDEGEILAADLIRRRRAAG